jgi:hypothetical protein
MMKSKELRDFKGEIFDQIFWDSFLGFLGYWRGSDFGFYSCLSARRVL